MSTETAREGPEIPVAPPEAVLPAVRAPADLAWTIVQMRAGERITVNEGLIAAYQAASSPHSIRALKSDVEAFDAWCRRNNRIALPATAETVADYLRQTLSVVTEGGAILRWLSDGFRVSAEEQYAEGQLAVACSGFSWGGAMCAVAAVVSERKVAAVPCCGSVSPECMVSNRTAVVQPHERQSSSRVRR